MLKYFDYIFYRIYTFYVAKGDSNPLIMTFNFIGILQIAILFAIALLVQRFTNLSLSSINKQYYWAIIAFVTVSFYSINMIRYLRRKYYLKIVKDNANSNLNVKVKTWMIFMLPILIIVSTVTCLLIFREN